MKRVSIVLLIMTLLLSGALGGGIVLAQDEGNKPFVAETIVDDDGNQIDKVIVPGRPPAIKAMAVAAPEPKPAAGTNSLANVPAFDWSYGCSPTSAAMLFGYYDRTGYVAMYSGPENGGYCPMDNTGWGSGECPLSTTHQGWDGLTTRGHVDDYWGNVLPTPDPWITGGWAEHAIGDCTGDFMGTSQSVFGQADGWTTFWFYTNGAPFNDWAFDPNRTGGEGVGNFAISRGYSVSTCYNQYIDALGLTYGFTFAQYVAEIDAGRPVLIHVEDHTMLGFGYDDATQKVYLHDTWDHGDHEMIWGGTYGTMPARPHYGVTVLQLDPVVNNPPVADAGSDQTVEANTTGGANVNLDGTGSHDPEGDPLTYDWSWSGGSASGPTPAVYLPLGMTTVTLTVDDGIYTDTDTVDVTVQDTTPPSITAPPDMTVIANTAGGWAGDIGTPTVSDICDAAPAVTNDAPAVFPLGDTSVTWTATDQSGNSASDDQVITVEPLPVNIDIKPCSDPNSINLRSKGVVPVAILTEIDFDALEVDPTTVEFAGASAVKWEMVDVCDHEVWDPVLMQWVPVGDGDLDLLVYFNTRDLNLINTSTEATLTGETLDGIPIEGTDSVKIPRGGKK